MKNRSLLNVFILVLVMGLIVTGCSTGETAEAPGETAIAEDAGEESPDPDNPEPLAAANKTRNPEEIFRFETTALYGEGGETINPTGMLLNIGCEDCQDIFYASRTLTIPEVIQKIQENFGVEEMLADENFVRFDLALDSVRKLEIELDLIAAQKILNETEIVDIRIISIAPVE